MNPELLRNLHIELTPERLVAMPVVLALAFLLLALIEERPGDLVAGWAVVGFLITATVLGARAAADSMLAEYQENTWDAQRMSGLTATRMAVGKLFGGAAFGWYGGVICLLVHVATAPEGSPVVGNVVMLIAGTVAIHALAVTTLIGRMRSGRSRARGGEHTWAGVLLVAAFFVVASPSLDLDEQETVHWYGAVVPERAFLIFTLLLAMLWSVLALVRVLRAELMHRDAPIVWTAFLVFLCGYVGGWAPALATGGPAQAGSVIVVWLLVALAICGAASWLGLFAERKDWVGLRAGVAHVAQGEWRLGGGYLPLWMVSLCLSLLAGVSAMIAIGLLGGAGADLGVPWVILGGLLFLLRDTFLLLGMSFTLAVRNTESAGFAYLVVLYTLVPGLFALLDLRGAVSMFLPFMLGEHPLSLIAIAFQVAAAAWFAWRRWKLLPN